MSDRLKPFFLENPRVALAFSGGVDSAYLLYAAVQSGCDVRPYYVKTAFQPQFEFDDAQRLAQQMGVSMHVIEKDILSIEDVRANPANRCYFCKRALFSEILAAAQRDGYRVLIDGTNASDDADDRPGMRALRELSVRSPLREANLTKPEIRALSKQAGLFTWNKPAYACLATRIPSGVAIDLKTLERIERSEDALKRMGFSDLRVRVIGKNAKLQLPEAQLPLALQKRAEILSALSDDFDSVLLDMKARQSHGA